jgi:hypothetical protein
MSEAKYEKLEQYDYADNEDFTLSEVKSMFAEEIGGFIISFNSIENELNISIAELLHQGTHEFGYQVVERLMMKNKIDLFYKLYLSLASHTKKKHKDHLKKLKDDLDDLNDFRNMIVHGNWILYNKDGYLRSKFTSDKDEGYIKFKFTQIGKYDFKKKMKKLVGLENNLRGLAERYLA